MVNTTHLSVPPSSNVFYLLLYLASWQCLALLHLRWLLTVYQKALGRGVALFCFTWYLPYDRWFWVTGTSLRPVWGREDSRKKSTWMALGLISLPLTLLLGVCYMASLNCLSTFFFIVLVAFDAVYLAALLRTTSRVQHHTRSKGWGGGC